MENHNFEVLENDSIEISNKVIDLRTVPMKRLEQMKTRYASKAESEDDFLHDGYYSHAHATIERVLKERISTPEVEQPTQDLYAIASSSLVGEEVLCPHCKNKFTKVHPKQAFCSNARSRRGGNCKDRYYNMQKDYRKERFLSMQGSIDA